MELMNVKNGLTMTSREIAELTGKRHSGIMRDIRNMLDSIGEGYELSVNKSMYKGISGQQYVQYELDIFAAATLVSGYSSEARYEIIKRAGEVAVREALQNVDFDSVDPDMFVYAMREVDTGKIKIGISRDPQRRMRQLQTGNSSKLELIALQPAIDGYEDERVAHLKAKHLQIHGEWYEPEAIEVLI